MQAGKDVICWTSNAPVCIAYDKAPISRRRQAIDTSTAAGKLTYTVLAAIAEFERNLISERVKSGMAAAKARGKHVGRKRILMAIANKIK